jgi:hypothetical protein
LVLVPSGGKHVIESFDTVYHAVLNRTLWGVEFFMLCDGDSSPPDSDTAKQATSEGRLRRLTRFHVENYFLDEDVWARAFQALDPPESWLRNPVEIRAKLRAIASEFVSYAVALAASSSLRRKVGNVDLMPKDVHGKSSEETQALFKSAAETELSRVSSILEGDEVRREVEGVFTRLEAALEQDSDDWKALIPGKQVLAVFAGKAGISLPRAKTLYIGAGLEGEHNPFQEVIELFDAMSS